MLAGCYDFADDDTRNNHPCSMDDDPIRAFIRTASTRDYSSENEQPTERRRTRRWSRTRTISSQAKDQVGDGRVKHGGESMVVITRPKGARKPICMDLEEVKACRDLGLELEHELGITQIKTIPLSVASTSSGESSPISALCISSPGEDPRDMKARLKVWAQAVALASTSHNAL